MRVSAVKGLQSSFWTGLAIDDVSGKRVLRALPGGRSELGKLHVAPRLRNEGSARTVEIPRPKRKGVGSEGKSGEASLCSFPAR